MLDEKCAVWILLSKLLLPCRYIYLNVVINLINNYYNLWFILDLIDLYVHICKLLSSFGLLCECAYVRMCIHI